MVRIFKISEAYQGYEDGHYFSEINHSAFVVVPDDVDLNKDFEALQNAAKDAGLEYEEDDDNEFGLIAQAVSLFDEPEIAEPSYLYECLNTVLLGGFIGRSTAEVADSAFLMANLSIRALKKNQYDRSEARLDFEEYGALTYALGEYLIRESAAVLS